MKGSVQQLQKQWLKKVKNPYKKIPNRFAWFGIFLFYLEK